MCKKKKVSIKGVPFSHIIKMYKLTVGFNVYPYFTRAKQAPSAFLIV